MLTSRLFPTRLLSPRLWQMLLTTGLMALTSASWAQGGPAPAAHDTVLATVNGQPLRRSLLDQMQRNRQEPNPFDLAAGVVTPPPPPVDRVQLLDELVFTELLYQKALEAGLDRDPSVQVQRQLQVGTVLSQQIVRELISQVEVSPEEVAALYEERVPPFDFKVQRLVLPQREQAEALIARAQRGERWAALVKGHPTEPADWFMFSQLEPAVGRAVRHLEVGRVAPAPVQVDGGWAVVRLEGRRKAPRPPLDEATTWLRPHLLSEKVQARLNALRQEARIELLPEASVASPSSTPSAATR